MLCETLCPQCLCAEILDFSAQRHRGRRVSQRHFVSPVVFRRIIEFRTIAGSRFATFFIFMFRTVARTEQNQQHKKHPTCFTNYTHLINNEQLTMNNRPLIINNYIHLFADFGKSRQSPVKMRLGMRRRKLYANTRLFLGHYRIIESDHINTFLQ